MRKPVMAAIAAISLLSSCGGSEKSAELAFETVKVEKSVSAGQETDAPKCSVRIEVAAAKGDSTSAAKVINDALTHELFYMEGIPLQQAADSFANKYTAEYTKNIVPLYREDRDDELKRAWYEYHYHVNSEIADQHDDVTVYKAVIDYYEGGAHGIQQELFFNFNNKTGQRITLSDIFVPGFEQQLCELLLQALIKQAGAEDADDLKEKGYLYAMDMFATENFILGSDEVTFVYNPYEIAPYAYGLVELTISKDDLKKIWK